MKHETLPGVGYVCKNRYTIIDLMTFYLKTRDLLYIYRQQIKIGSMKARINNIFQRNENNTN